MTLSKKPTTPFSYNLIILGRQLIINIPYQRNPHLRSIIPPQHVTDKMGLHLHLYHFKGSSQHATQDIRVPQFILSAAVVGQFDKVGKGVFVKDEGELVVVCGPVCYLGGYVEEDFETDLFMF